MTHALWAMTLIWIVLFIYALAASVDFGAGFWSLIFGARNPEASTLAARYVSPLWEVTNVFLVLFAVGFVGFFPEAAFVYGTILLVPGSLILVLLALRGSFLVFAYTSRRSAGTLRIVSGVTGLLLPALFVSVLPISEGGFVEIVNQHYQLMIGKLFSSPVEYAYLVFGLATELFFSSVLMTDYARAAGKQGAESVYRRAALMLGPVTLLSALLVQGLQPTDSAWMRYHLDAAFPGFTVSLLAFVVGYGALWIRRPNHAVPGRPRLAVVAIVVQYGLAVFAYGWAHLPFVLYPYLTVEKAFTNGAMFEALLVVLVIGLSVLFPAFIWFWRLFMEDKRYVSGGQ